MGSMGLNWARERVPYKVLNTKEIADTEVKEDEIEEIFAFWNEQGIIKHKDIVSHYPSIRRALKRYSKEEITKAISNYKEVITNTSINSNGYKPYIWSLSSFLMKPNAMLEYMDDGTRWVNYSNRLKDRKKPVNGDLNRFNELFLELINLSKQINYNDYLQSRHWKEFREKAIINASCVCQVCGKQEGLNVHHKNYECMGQETFADVVVLCRSCHGKVHGKDKSE